MLNRFWSWMNTSTNPADPLPAHWCALIALLVYGAIFGWLYWSVSAGV